VSLPSVRDDSADPANIPGFYELPDATEPPRVVRNFRFGFNLFPDKPKGLWTINGQPFSTMDQPRFRVKRNSVEHWLFQNVTPKERRTGSIPSTSISRNSSFWGWPPERT
jgi:hypothetical protein